METPSRDGCASGDTDGQEQLDASARRFYSEQRARVGRLDATGISFIACFVVASLGFNVETVLWSVALLTCVAAGYAVGSGALPERFRSLAESWWVRGASVIWAVLPVLHFRAADDATTSWILVFVVVFGLASDAVYLPQTYAIRMLPMALAYTAPYVFVFAAHGHWFQVFAVGSILVHVSWGSDSTVRLVAELIEDRAEATSQYESARESSLTDPLTKMRNRQGMVQLVDSLCANEDVGVVQCCFIDLDDFKSINDNYGYEAGDHAIQTFAAAVDELLPPGWFLGRFGGDEFVAVGSFADLTGLARRITELRVKIEVGNGRGVVEDIGGSAGGAVLKADETDAQELFLHSSAALQEAKALGKHRYVISDEKLRSAQKLGRTLASELGAALSAGELVAYAQPQVLIETQEVVGLELLARWHRQGESIPPSVFLPLVASSGYGRLFDNVMVGHAVRALEQLRLVGLPDIRVAVNVFASQLVDPQLPTRLLSVLADRDLDPSLLTIEITETEELFIDGLVSAVTSKLRAAGCNLSIDDFGTGYSSITQLLSIPFTEMKLDLSLVQRAGAPDVNDLLTGLADFGMRNGLTIVAEGVETEGQLSVIRSLGIEIGQGYLFGRPTEVSPFIERLALDASTGLAAA